MAMHSPPPAAVAKTTRARSIVTLDNYVSRGHAPPSSVPRDHSMLQDFAAYLELRLKSQNLAILRRIFADFLNEQENTLEPMMQQGCTIITVYPVLRTSAKRRKLAATLLAKPKHPLDARGCVFLYLQYRTATRNMALMKHLFLEFLYHRETALLDFVARGAQVISVIPFALPSSPPAFMYPPQQSAAVERSTPKISEPVEVDTIRKKARRTKSIHSVVETNDEAVSSVVEPRVVPTKRNVVVKTRSQRGKSDSPSGNGINDVSRTSPSTASSTPIRRRKRLGAEVEQSERAAVTMATATAVSSILRLRDRIKDSSEQEELTTAAFSVPKVKGDKKNLEAKPKHKGAATTLPPAGSISRTRKRSEALSGDGDATNTGLAAKGGKNPVATAPEQEKPAAVAPPVKVHRKRGRKRKEKGMEKKTTLTPTRTTTRSIRKSLEAVGAQEEPTPLVGSIVKPRRKRTNAVMLKENTNTTSLEGKTAPRTTTTKASPVLRSTSQDLPKKRKRRKIEYKEVDEGEVRKKGKQPMSEAMCRRQQEFTQKLVPFEDKVPWNVVFANLPAPFEKDKHPALAAKLRAFWRVHARAVWERNFWAPISRKRYTVVYNARNNRQLSAKTAFEILTLEAYRVLGAEFFIKLDAQRHPGWWYRGPIVALFALEELKGEKAVWDYVRQNALERFPDCKLPLPLKSPNSGAVEKRHKTVSPSAWACTHDKSTQMLRAIADLKAQRQQRKEVATDSLSVELGLEADSAESVLM